MNNDMYDFTHRTYVAVVDLVVFRVLDDLADLLDGAIHVGTDTANDDDILRVRVGLCADLDG